MTPGAFLLTEDTTERRDDTMTDPNLTPAVQLLHQTMHIVSGARRKSYGKPERNFETIAGLWNVYLGASGRNAGLTATDITVMMSLLKIARLAETPAHADSWRDLAGYAAVGAEVSGADLSDMVISCTKPATSGHPARPPVPDIDGDPNGVH